MKRRARSVSPSMQRPPNALGDSIAGGQAPGDGGGWIEPGPYVLRPMLPFHETQTQVDQSSTGMH